MIGDHGDKVIISGVYLNQEGSVITKSAFGLQFKLIESHADKRGSALLVTGQLEGCVRAENFPFLFVCVCGTMNSLSVCSSSV